MSKAEGAERSEGSRIKQALACVIASPFSPVIASAAKQSQKNVVRGFSLVQGGTNEQS
jgi:hypothetical protein